MRTPDRALASGSGLHLMSALLGLLLAAAVPVQAKQARATLNLSVTVLSACEVTAGQRVAITCTGSSTLPTIDQREQGTGAEHEQLTVVRF